ncbi:hypothetical protein [Butyrivibrio hungatei]|nr:hypothetical protein [Butyrivibrio hungatei]
MRKKEQIIMDNFYKKSANMNISLTEYMYYLHSAFPLMEDKDKEHVLVEVLERFPLAYAYALLKLSGRKINIVDYWAEEYKETGYKSFIDDVEADIEMGFGNIELFITYSRLYIPDANSITSELADKIKYSFAERRRENFGTWKKSSINHLTSF